jgi:hypothetical protein
MKAVEPSKDLLWSQALTETVTKLVGSDDEENSKERFSVTIDSEAGLVATEASLLQLLECCFDIVHFK